MNGCVCTAIVGSHRARERDEHEDIRGGRAEDRKAAAPLDRQLLVGEQLPHPLDVFAQRQAILTRSVRFSSPA